MVKNRRNSSKQIARKKPPLQVGGIVFGLLINVIFVTLAGLIDSSVRAGIGQISITSSPLPVIIGAVIAGSLTSMYVGRRGGTHAFIGGMLSIPILLYVSLNGRLPLALYAAAFCALGGLVMERLRPSID